MMSDAVAARVDAARRARAREQLGRLDFLREVREVAVAVETGEVAVSEVERALKAHGPALSRLFESARGVSVPVPGFSGAGPYEIAQRYAVGELTREQLVEELVRWSYPPMERIEGLWDELVLTKPGEWEEVVRASTDGLIDDDLYTEILDLNEPPEERVVPVRREPTADELEASAEIARIAAGLTIALPDEMPVESVLHGMQTRFEPVTFNQMARFEAAEDILNQHVGTAMARVYAEERKAVPDQGVVDEMRRRAEEFAAARRALSVEDRAAVDEVLARARAVTEELEGA